MLIDNSAAQMFRMCPWAYYEAYLRNGRGVQPIPAKEGEEYSTLEFGERVHEKLEVYYKTLKAIQAGDILYHTDPYPTRAESLEQEATWMLEAYINHYPSDNWEIIDVERTFKVRLPNSDHIYVGKIDLFIRDNDNGCFYIIDHKTEKRGSKSHIPQKLAVSDQGSLYLWAARKVYDGVDGMKYNILVRPSEARKIGPSFPERYLIERTEHDIEIAVRDITLIADQIEEYTKRFGDREWPANRANCYTWGPCDFYPLHKFGDDPSLILQHKFQQREEYLNVENVEVVD